MFGLNAGPEYTRTGNGSLTKWANAASLIPWLRSVPIIGKTFAGTLTGILGFADTAIEAAGYLFKGQFGSAATVAAAGTASVFVNTISDSPAFWWLNVGSTAITGATLGTHARKLTEEGLGVVTGALGIRPEVLSSHTAAIGGIGGNSMAYAYGNQAPGPMTSKIAQERGQNADAYWQQKRGGEAGAYVSPGLTGAQGVA